jgi:hypothetical protein
MLRVLPHQPLACAACWKHLEAADTSSQLSLSAFSLLSLPRLTWLRCVGLLLPPIPAYRQRIEPAPRHLNATSLIIKQQCRFRTRKLGQPRGFGKNVRSSRPSYSTRGDHLRCTQLLRTSAFIAIIGMLCRTGLSSAWLACSQRLRAALPCRDQRTRPLHLPKEDWH